MTPPVFAHGHLRLYLLSLLEDQPRHGYELIQALSERFDGTYSPSAGTIYPRLAKLEEEGLVTKHNDGRKSVYRITEAGRRELDSRREELASIEQDVDSSVRRLAADVRHGLTSAREELRAEFARLAQELGPDARAGFEKAASAGAAGAASARGFFAGAAKGWNEPREAPISTPGETPPGFTPPGFGGGATASGEPRPQDPPQAPTPPQTPGTPQPPKLQPVRAPSTAPTAGTTPGHRPAAHTSGKAARTNKGHRKAALPALAAVPPAAPAIRSVRPAARNWKRCRRPTSCSTSSDTSSARSSAPPRVSSASHPAS